MIKVEGLRFKEGQRFKAKGQRKVKGQKTKVKSRRSGAKKFQMTKFENPPGAKLSAPIDKPKAHLCPDERLVVDIKGFTVIRFNKRIRKTRKRRIVLQKRSLILRFSC